MIIEKGMESLNSRIKLNNLFIIWMMNQPNEKDLQNTTMLKRKIYIIEEKLMQCSQLENWWLRAMLFKNSQLGEIYNAYTSKPPGLNLDPSWTRQLSCAAVYIVYCFVFSILLFGIKYIYISSLSILSFDFDFILTSKL